MSMVECPVCHKKTPDHQMNIHKEGHALACDTCFDKEVVFTFEELHAIGVNLPTLIFQAENALGSYDESAKVLKSAYEKIQEVFADLEPLDKVRGIESFLDTEMEGE